MPFQKDTITRLLTFILVAYAARLFDLTPKISPWAADVSGSAFTEMHRATDVYMSKRMPIFVQSFAGLKLLFLGLTWKNRSSWSFRLIALALALQVIGTVLAIKTNVAMNAGTNDWDPAHLPINWKAVRDAWLGAHHRNFLFNVVCSILVFTGCYRYWLRPQAAR